METEFDRVEFGRRLQECRERKRITKKELAQNIGVTLSQICHYENGDDLPKYDILKKIACFLEISADYLLAVPVKNNITADQSISGQKKILIDKIINISDRDAEFLSSVIPQMLESLDHITDNSPKDGDCSGDIP